jgi:diaminopimelate epimerase
MQHTFYKYQGTGNDFVIIDNREDFFDKNDTKLIADICDRRFGIGADGLILLEQHDTVDFKMVYFNADGNESSMCGNGGRCITAFAKYLGIINFEATFEAIDGLHHSIIDNDLVKLQMQDVDHIENSENHVCLDTGSPHHVLLHSKLKELDVKYEGAKIRYNEYYNEEGVNVNFVDKIDDNTFAIRTYERGVEDETLSCGTGVTAVALAMHYLKEAQNNVIDLKTEGGNLQVSFVKEGDVYKDIWLTGPAKMVFKGELEW